MQLPLMSAPEPNPESNQPHARASLTHRTARGVAWMTLQTVSTQVVNLGGFLILGWLLDNTAFGLFALVTTISSFVALSKQFGLNTVIIHRFDRFGIYCNPAMWMTLALGILATVAAIGAAPLGSMIYDQPQLTGMVIIFALGILPDAMSGVPEAALAARMRFKSLAIIQFTWVSVLIVLTVIFALLDFGAYSFVLPQPIAQTLRLILGWSVARPKMRRSPQFRRWRFFVRDSVAISIGNLANWTINQADYVILGILHPEAIVGLYFFGFRVGTRVVVLFMQSLRSVLMPAFSSIKDDPERQRLAYVRTNSLLAILTAPVCAMQVLLAEPFFELCLPVDKQPAAVVVQIMAIASFFRVVRQPAASLILAQGRFLTATRITVVLAALFVLSVTIAALIGAERTVAAVVSGHAAVNAMTFMIVAAGSHFAASVLHATRIIVRPLAIATILLCLAYLMAVAISATGSWLYPAVVAPVVIVLYALVIRVSSPAEFRIVQEAVVRTLSRR